MQLFIVKDKQQTGPFSEEQIQGMLASGSVAPTDLAWHEGLSGWLPLNQVLDVSPGNPQAAPPPMPSMNMPPAANKKNEPLTTWALVLGIISIVGCGILAGIPAVICGHVSLSRIKRNPSLGGRGKAVAGLITGYISILIMAIVAIFTLLALPGIKMGVERSKAQEMLSNMKQIHLVLQQVALDGTTTGDKTIGWPADAHLKSKAELKKMVVPAYISDGDYDRMQFDKISIGNVSENDPADTILLEYKPASGGPAVVFLKSGDGQVSRAGQTFGNPPPRDPAFLE